MRAFLLFLCFLAVSCFATWQSDEGSEFYEDVDCSERLIRDTDYAGILTPITFPAQETSLSNALADVTGHRDFRFGRFGRFRPRRRPRSHPKPRPGTRFPQPQLPSHPHPTDIVTAGRVTAERVTAGRVTAGRVTAGSVTTGSVTPKPRLVSRILKRLGNSTTRLVTSENGMQIREVVTQVLTNVGVRTLRQWYNPQGGLIGSNMGYGGEMGGMDGSYGNGGMGGMGGLDGSYGNGGMGGPMGGDPMGTGNGEMGGPDGSMGNGGMGGTMGGDLGTGPMENGDMGGTNDPMRKNDNGGMDGSMGTNEVGGFNDKSDLGDTGGMDKNVDSNVSSDDGKRVSEFTRIQNKNAIPRQNKDLPWYLR